MTAISTNQTLTDLSSQASSQFKTTKQPLLPTLTASTMINNNKQVSQDHLCAQIIINSSLQGCQAVLHTNNNRHLYFKDHLHQCFHPTTLQYRELNNNSSQDPTPPSSIHRSPDNFTMTLTDPFINLLADKPHLSTYHLIYFDSLVLNADIYQEDTDKEN